MSTPLVVALHGATGTRGRPVARRLLEDGHDVRAVVRRPGRAAGCRPAAADLLDARSLAGAYAGADAVVVRLPAVFDDRAWRMARCVVAAVHGAQVQRVVVDTGCALPAAPTGLPYLDARRALVETLAHGPCDVAVVQPVAPAMEDLAVRDGVVVCTAAALPYIALDDVAGEIAAALRDGRSRLVCGPRAWTGPEVAAVLGDAAGRPVRWRTVAPVQPGDAAAGGFARVHAALARTPAPDPALLRVGTTDLVTWARRQAWRPALAA